MIDAEADRLDGLVGNLLDMSRLQTGALQVAATPIGLDEVVPAALRSIGPRADEVDVDVAETLPESSQIRGCSSARSPTSYRTPWYTASGRRYASSPEPSTAASTSALSTVGPASRKRIATASSSRSSASATARRAGASGSGWPSRAASSRRWAASVEVEDTPGGGLTMILRLPGSG